MKSVILAGGKGTRLWPMSTKDKPKQFLKIIDDSSLLQQTIKRSLNYSSPDEIYVVTLERYREITRKQMDELEIEIPEENIIMEPFGRNTLPATILATKNIIERNGNSKIGVFPSDHLIETDESYIRSIKDGIELSDDYLVTFGINPSGPHTGYGYIKPGEKVEKGYRIKEFVEKPSMSLARKYINEGYLWNSGKFLFDSEIFLNICEELYPDLMNKIKNSNNLKDIYKEFPSVSIDNGIMEKTEKGATIPINSYWNDIGSYSALHDHLKKDENNNVIQTKCKYLESKNNFIKTKKPVANVGISNIVLVETDDLIFICSKDKTKELKKFVKNNNILDDLNDK